FSASLVVSTTCTMTGSNSRWTRADERTSSRESASTPVVVIPPGPAMCYLLDGANLDTNVSEVLRSLVPTLVRVVEDVYRWAGALGACPCILLGLLSCPSSGAFVP